MNNTIIFLKLFAIAIKEDTWVKTYIIILKTDTLIDNQMTLIFQVRRRQTLGEWVGR